MEDIEAAFQEFMTHHGDKSFSLRLDVECPIKCGACCQNCQMNAYTKTGCSLPRKDRPWVCNAYMCAEGTMAYNG